MSRRDTMLPNSADQQFIEHLMSTPVMDIGKFAGWIAPPRVGIDNRPGDFEYVKLA
jgi:benzoyl-CoA 2,3-dioxygenase component B